MAYGLWRMVFGLDLIVSGLWVSAKGLAFRIQSVGFRPGPCRAPGVVRNLSGLRDFWWQTKTLRLPPLSEVTLNPTLNPPTLNPKPHKP
jgi:hypothetical protein